MVGAAQLCHQFQFPTSGAQAPHQPRAGQPIFLRPGGHHQLPPNCCVIQGGPGGLQPAFFAGHLQSLQPGAMVGPRSTSFPPLAPSPHPGMQFGQQQQQQQQQQAQQQQQQHNSHQTAMPPQRNQAPPPYPSDGNHARMLSGAGLLPAPYHLHPGPTGHPPPTFQPMAPTQTPPHLSQQTAHMASQEQQQRGGPVAPGPGGALGRSQESRRQSHPHHNSRGRGLNSGGRRWRAGGAQGPGLLTAGPPGLAPLALGQAPLHQVFHLCFSLLYFLSFFTIVNVRPIRLASCCTCWRC